MDSFKGCLDADAVCAAVKKGITEICGNEAVSLPLADGGEGTAAAICHALGGELISCNVIDPFGDIAEGYFGEIKSSGLAVLDTAAASGIELAKIGRGGILDASTLGTGRQILDMLDAGFRRITVGLGGSGTNDGGIGALSALGAVFYDKNGRKISRPCAAVLGDIRSVDISELDSRLNDTELSLMYDVDIPLTGERGSTRNYSPQKGANPETVELLEEGMCSYAYAMHTSLGIDASGISGAGAAGGLGFGLHVAGGKLVNGAEHMLKLCDFDRLADECDIVITGEGRTDFQTAHGKLPAAVAVAAKRHSVPVICICGAASPVPELYELGIDGIFAIPNAPITLDESLAKAPELISMLSRNIAGIIAAL